MSKIASMKDIFALERIAVVGFSTNPASLRIRYPSILWNRVTWFTL